MERRNRISASDLAPNVKILDILQHLLDILQGHGIISEEIIRTERSESASRSAMDIFQEDYDRADVRGSRL